MTDAFDRRRADLCAELEHVRGTLADLRCDERVLAARIETMDETRQLLGIQQIAEAIAPTVAELNLAVTANLPLASVRAFLLRAVRNGTVRRNGDFYRLPRESADEIAAMPNGSDAAPGPGNAGRATPQASREAGDSGSRDSDIDPATTVSSAPGDADLARGAESPAAPDAADGREGQVSDRHQSGQRENVLTQREPAGEQQRDTSGVTAGRDRQLLIDALHDGPLPYAELVDNLGIPDAVVRAAERAGHIEYACLDGAEAWGYRLTAAQQEAAE